MKQAISALRSLVAEPRSGRRTFAGTGLVCLCFLLAAGTPAQQTKSAGTRDGGTPTFTTFDAPGAGTANAQGTFAQSINEGAIAGFYIDGSGVYHGFVRAAGGTITTFDAPGAGTAAGQGTYAHSINTAGVIAGYYADTSNVDHGFLRAADGATTTFDAPGASTSAGQGTYAYGINTAGSVTGFYQDTFSNNNGFVRAASGAITAFNVPFSDTQTLPFSINARGVIAGYYIASHIIHGFVRTSGGAVTIFDAPNAGADPGMGTFAFCINNLGAIVGSYNGGGVPARNGFMRHASDVIDTFGAQGASAGTYAKSIDDTGDITGHFCDTSCHGFVRGAGGSMNRFDVPGAGAGSGQGTYSESIGQRGRSRGIFSNAIQF